MLPLVTKLIKDLIMFETTCVASCYSIIIVDVCYEPHGSDN